MKTIKINGKEVKLIDIYVETDASKRLPKPGSYNHYIVYSNGNVSTTGWGDSHKMKRQLEEYYCTKLIWLRNVFYDK